MSGELDLRRRGLVSRALSKAVVSPDRRGKVTARRPFLAERDHGIHNDLARQTGAVVFSSSTSAEASYEMDSLGGGVFTVALENGLSRASLLSDRDGMTSFPELARYVSEAVATVTHGEQHPVVDHDNPLADIWLPRAPGFAVRDFGYGRACSSRRLRVRHGRSARSGRRPRGARHWCRRPPRRAKTEKTQHRPMSTALRCR